MTSLEKMALKTGVLHQAKAAPALDSPTVISVPDKVPALEDFPSVTSVVLVLDRVAPHSPSPLTALQEAALDSHPQIPTRYSSKYRF